MNQNDLNRAVAQATGETVECIRRMGFTLTVVPTLKHHPRIGTRSWAKRSRKQGQRAPTR